ncbi:MAG: HAD-IA family hydrolase [Alphaproteobacteria bacterium]|nr:HAD-IA family hydrolase [Alphaproteobacteria bacterium]
MHRRGRTASPILGGGKFALVAKPGLAYGSGMTPAYVFDLDGTLVDTAPDLCFSLNVILRREGRREMDLAEMPLLIGNGVKKLIERAFVRGGIDLAPQRLDALYADFVGIYAVYIADRSRPFAGVVETLETLTAQGARLAVLTNKPHDSAVRLLDALDLARFFPVVFGGGRREYLKPDARLFEEVVRELGGGPAVMVGDSRPDVETARNAGAPVVLVSFGYSVEPIGTLGADIVVDRFADVPAAVERLLKGFGNS